MSGKRRHHGAAPPQWGPDVSLFLCGGNMAITKHANYKTMHSLRESGFTLQQIADLFSVSKERVRQILGNTGTMAAKVRKERYFDSVIGMRTAGYTIDEIVEETNLLESTIRDWCNGIVENQVPEGYRKCSRCGKVLFYDWKNFYGNTTVCIECTKRHQRRYNKSYVADPKKTNCRAATHRLLKAGKLTKGECQMKGADCRGRIEAHHYAGYDHPELVEWYCARHHRMIDGARWGRSNANGET